jgi:hypothetical protein
VIDEESRRLAEGMRSRPTGTRPDHDQVGAPALGQVADRFIGLPAQDGTLDPLARQSSGRRQRSGGTVEDRFSRFPLGRLDLGAAIRSQRAAVEKTLASML